MAKTSIKASNPTASKEDVNELIRKKAYELYEKNGKKPGSAMNNWLEAEKFVATNISK